MTTERNPATPLLWLPLPFFVVTRGWREIGVESSQMLIIAIAVTVAALWQTLTARTCKAESRSVCWWLWTAVAWTVWGF